MHLAKTHPGVSAGPEWAKEYVEQRIDVATSSTSKQFHIPDFKREYFESQPEILEFMKEYDINQQKRHLAHLSDDNAVLNKVEEELGVAGSWTDEFIKDNNLSGIYP